MEYERDEFNNIVTVTSEEGILEKATHRRASIIEAKALMECKSIVLKQMLPNIEPNKRIFKIKNRNKYEEYRKNVVALLKSEFGINIDSFYDGYEIALNETNTEYNTEYYLQKLSLKNKIKAKMLNCNNAEYRKALECDIFKEGLFGEEVIAEANEVIINVTNMMVEDAERFGLAGLHQLRGRVGRGNAQSYCIFVSGAKNKDTRERLEILNSSNDGFYIANKDLSLRGPGDFFGIRQSGDMSFKLGDIYADASTLKLTADILKEVTEGTIVLKTEESEVLKHKLDKYIDMHYTINL